MALQVFENMIKTAEKAKARIAIGLRKAGDRLISEINEGKKWADIVVVGEKIEGFESLEGDFSTLVNLVKDGKVEAIVKGNFQSDILLDEIQRLFNLEKVIRMALLKIANEKGEFYFYIGPDRITNEHSMEDRMKLIEKGTAFIRSWGGTPKVGVISAGHLGHLGKDPLVDQSMAEAEMLTSFYRDRINITNYYKKTSKAVKEGCNLIITPGSMITQFIGDVLVNLAGGDWLYEHVFMDECIYVHSSSTKGGLLRSIIMATALVNKKKFG
ncbi:MAG: hypothetical protein K8T10_15900 [Candidatus Eremiobacteraeota bacterium]|nr:hypothetical protein [Candidatus Eremiobacteraeota bacterium]